jgi:hypothetical protein
MNKNANSEGMKRDTEKRMTSSADQTGLIDRLCRLSQRPIYHHLDHWFIGNRLNIAPSPADSFTFHPLSKRELGVRHQQLLSGKTKHRPEKLNECKGSFAAVDLVSIFTV